MAFSANTAHHLDIGAATPGLIIDIPDVYAEGMLFAGTKLYEEGRRNEALWEYIPRPRACRTDRRGGPHPTRFALGRGRSLEPAYAQWEEVR